MPLSRSTFTSMYPGRVRVCELLCVYFALNPHEALRASDIQAKFGISTPSSVWKSCLALRKRGMLTATLIKGNGGHYYEYSIGPTLAEWVKQAQSAQPKELKCHPTSLDPSQTSSTRR